MLKKAKQNGFADTKIASLWGMTAEQVRRIRQEQKILPVYKMVDTCAAEFGSATPYFYSTYGFENESVKSSKESVLVLGSGPVSYTHLCSSPINLKVLLFIGMTGFL